MNLYPLTYLKMLRRFLLVKIVDILPFQQFGRFKVLKENSHFRNIHSGKRCFILGSGPSIKNQDLKLLRNEFVITQNNFHAHHDIEIIRPQIHMVVPMFHSKEAEPTWIEWFKSMEERLPSDTKVFFSLNSQKIVRGLGIFQGRCYFYTSHLNPIFLKRAHVDFCRVLMQIPTAISLCLSAALYMGFSEIYLLGFDMDQICHPGQQGGGNRFYGTSPILENKDELNIVHTNRTTGKSYFNRWALCHQLNLLKVYADQKKIRIINLTPGGLLETFERMNYNDIL